VVHLSEILDIQTTEQINKKRQFWMTETYKTMPVFWTFKMHHWKYKVSNKAPLVYSQWQSVKQIPATLHAADVQSVDPLCSRTHNRRRGRHCLMAQSMILWSKICHSSTRRVMRRLTSQMRVRYTRCSNMRSRCDDQQTGLLGGHNCGDTSLEIAEKILCIKFC